MRAAALYVITVLVACGPSVGEKGEKGDRGDPGPPGPMGSAASTLGQQIVEVYGTGQLQVGGATNFSLVPGLSANVTIPAGARVRVDTSGGIQCTGLGNAYSVVDVAIFIDDGISTAGGQRRVVAANTTGLAQTVENWSFTRSYTLPAGNHTFEVRAAGGDPSATVANVSSAGAPQLQGTLTVTVLLQ